MGKKKKINTDFLIVVVPLIVFVLAIFMTMLQANLLRPKTATEVLEEKYGIEFVAEKVTRNSYPDKELYFCHPVFDENIRFSTFKEDDEWTDDFLEQMVLQDVYQKLEEEFEAAGIEMCYQGHIQQLRTDNRQELERDYWEDETNYLMAREDFESEYADKMFYSIYVVLKRSDFETKEDVEKIWNIAKKCSEYISGEITLWVVWVSDIRFQEISDFFAHTPYTRDYTIYSIYYMRNDQTVLPFSMIDGSPKSSEDSVERYYELFLKKKDWDDSASIYEEVYRRRKRRGAI